MRYVYSYLVSILDNLKTVPYKWPIELGEVLDNFQPASFTLTN
jgi:hypothetical protein